MPQKKGWGGKVEPAELYHLKDDPGESKNIIGKQSEKAEAMAKQLAELMGADGVR